MPHRTNIYRARAGQHAWTTRTAWITLGVLLAMAAAAALLIAGSFTDRAGATDPPLVPGAACPDAGRLGVLHGQQYRCWQKPDETCPHWHWVYHPGPSGSPWSPRPAGPCPCTPTPTVSVSPSGGYGSRPPSSPPGTVPAPSTTPVGYAGTLPLTGPHTRVVVWLGLGFVAAGVGCLLLGRRRRQLR